MKLLTIRFETVDGEFVTLPLEAFTDAAIEKAASIVAEPHMLKSSDPKNEEFPDFTVYEDGVEIGGN